MINRKVIFQVLIAVLGLAVFAAADTVSIKFAPNDSGLGGPTQGVYYYPYQLTVNGSELTVACDDFQDEVYNNETWQANENFFSNLSGALFYNGTSPTTIATSIANYEEAAWLFSQFKPTPPLVDSVNAAVNIAMWDIFEPGSMTQGHLADTTTSSAWWIQEAGYWLNGSPLLDASLSGPSFANFDFSDYVLFTAVDGSEIPSKDGRPQEYMAEVPEPGTILLFATGLLGLGMLEWKRRQALS